MFRKTISFLALAFLLSACGFWVRVNPVDVNQTQQPTAVLLPTSIPEEGAPPEAFSPAPGEQPPTSRALPPSQDAQSTSKIAPSAQAQPAGISPEPVIYLVQVGTPIFMPNFVYPEKGCDWMGVGGQVFDKTANPVTGLVVEVTGNLEDKAFLKLGLTGGATELGPGGFMITLAEHPVTTQDSLRLQVYNVEGKMLSAPVVLDTSADCNQNLVIINFTQAVNLRSIYFPLTQNNP